MSTETFKIEAAALHEGLSAAVATSHPMASATEVGELAHQLAMTGAYRIVGGTLRPVIDDLAALSAARAVDRVTVQRIASAFASGATNPAKRTSLELAAQGIDPHDAFGDGSVPVRILQTRDGEYSESTAEKTIRELRARGLDPEDLIA